MLFCISTYQHVFNRRVWMSTGINGSPSLMGKEMCPHKLYHWEDSCMINFCPKTDNGTSSLLNVYCMPAIAIVVFFLGVASSSQALVFTHLPAVARWQQQALHWDKPCANLLQHRSALWDLAGSVMMSQMNEASRNCLAVTAVSPEKLLNRSRIFLPRLRLTDLLTSHPESWLLQLLRESHLKIGPCFFWCRQLPWIQKISGRGKLKYKPTLPRCLQKLSAHPGTYVDTCFAHS